MRNRKDRIGPAEAARLGEAAPGKCTETPHCYYFSSWLIFSKFKVHLRQYLWYGGLPRLSTFLVVVDFVGFRRLRGVTLESDIGVRHWRKSEQLSVQGARLCKRSKDVRQDIRKLAI